jgi:hypothetical protein
MLQIVASLTYNSRDAIYDSHIFIVHAADLNLIITLAAISSPN